MNAKVKMPSGAGSKQKANGNLPITGQGLKIGVGQASGSGMQHPSHAKKLTEGKMTGSKAGLGQHKYTNSVGGGNATPAHIDMAKKTAFELSRN